MARIIEELYCQVDGKVYVSRDDEQDGSCIGCDLSRDCPIVGNRVSGICSSLDVIWKELKADE